MAEDISKLLLAIETRIKNLQLEFNGLKRDSKDNTENIKKLESKMNTIEAERNAEAEFIKVSPELEEQDPKQEIKPEIPGHQISER